MKMMQNAEVSIEIESEKEVKVPDNDKWGSDQVQDIIPKLGIVNRIGTYPYIKPKPLQPRTNISR